MEQSHGLTSCVLAPFSQEACGTRLPPLSPKMLAKSILETPASVYNHV
ncbi:hypothetical protein [Candidatus Protochlamydia naegleriophila]|nr:hypothetical protein [Candidatus Protochlamydia naegleriophila]